MKKIFVFHNIRVSVEASDPQEALRHINSAVSSIPGMVDWESDTFSEEDPEGYCDEEHSTAELVSKQLVG